MKETSTTGRVDPVRVQIPAYTDRWMRGDRFGNVVKITKRKPRHNKPEYEIAVVLLDKSNKLVNVLLADCEVL